MHIALFAKPPGAGGAFLEPEEVMAVRTAAAEKRSPSVTRPRSAARAGPRLPRPPRLGTTMDYVVAMSPTRLSAETKLVFSSRQPGCDDRNRGICRSLRPFNPSMGLMLENISPRLMEPGSEQPRLRQGTGVAGGDHRSCREGRRPLHQRDPGRDRGASRRGDRLALRPGRAAAALGGHSRR